MIIDGHSHVTLPVEEHIRLMDRAGIYKTVLFSTTFHPELANNASEVKEKMNYLNDLLAGKKGSMVELRKRSVIELVDAVKKHPDRYIGFGAVPTGLSLIETKEYIEKNIVKSNLSGIGEFTLGVGQAHLLDNIFQASRDFSNLPIWIHAFYPFTLNDIKETASLAKTYPENPVILGHLGGFNWIETMDIVKKTPNLFLDTSANYSTLILKTVINEIPEKCIFGVDMPFGDIELSKLAIIKFAKSEEIADAVLGENVAKLLGI